MHLVDFVGSFMLYCASLVRSIYTHGGETVWTLNRPNTLISMHAGSGDDWPE